MKSKLNMCKNIARDRLFTCLQLHVCTQVFLLHMRGWVSGWVSGWLSRWLSRWLREWKQDFFLLDSQYLLFTQMCAIGNDQPFLPPGQSFGFVLSNFVQKLSQMYDHAIADDGQTIFADDSTG